MSYLGYKSIAFRKHMKEQERIKMWKAEQARKRLKLRGWKNLYKATLAHVVIAIMLIALYSLVYVTSAKADTVKIGEGPFVMAVSYTESYNDLEYVANFMSCAEAEKFYYANCINAFIMMCQLEEHLYMPLNHNSDNSFSSFDFEVSAQQSCGFVKTQDGYSTFIED
tara:strand:+ start:177 stop:677 length:501 start_codon:yes stop_codon:yes gene_type:complete